MITYGSTTLTSYNTITKIEVYYYKSTSPTSLSGGSWSTTKPTWKNGKYIWQKIRTTYEGKLENGQYYSESDPVNITGQQGQQGETGASAYSYKLNASDTIVSVSKNGVYSTNSITFSATSKQGNENVNPYEGRFKIETTMDGITWTIQYTSSADESSKIFTIPSDISNIRCSLYQAGGTTVLLDITSVSIVRDGIDGALYPNLSPFFSHDLTDVYNAETNPNGYWIEYSSYGWTKNSKFTFTQLEDGWLHVHIDNSSGTSVIKNDCCISRYNPSIKKGTMYTFLTEFRNNQSTGIDATSNFYLVQQGGDRSVQFWGINTTIAPSVKLEGIGGLSIRVIDIPSDGSYAIARGTKYSEPEDSSSHWTTEDAMATFTFRANAGAVIDYDIRLSMYEGEYWGNYVPYIISDVTDIRNSAETANNKIDNLEIGGRNILLNSATNFPKIYKSSTLITEKDIVVPEFKCTNGLRCYGKTGTDNNICLLINDSSHGLSVSSTTSVEDQQYVLSIYIKNNHETNPFFVTSNIPSISGTQSIQPGEAKRVVFYATGDDYHGIQIILKTNAAEDDYDITLWHPQIEFGNKVTDWSPAPEDVENSIKAYAESIQSQVDGMAEIHYGTAVPTLSNAPYTSWGDTATRDMHVDDLYYNTSTGYCYRFTKSGSTYSWSRIKDSDITAAATAASNANTAAGNAQTTANNANTLAGQKRRIFVTQPTPPYEVGDLWVEGSNGDIKKCKTTRASGSYTASDWELASKYTDDTLAGEANDKIDNLEIGGRNLILDTSIERISPASVNNSAYVMPTPTMSDYASGILNNRDDYFTYSFDYEVTGNEASDAYVYVQIRRGSVPSTSDGYYSYVLENPTGKHCCTFKLTKAQATETYTGCGIRLKNATDGAVLRVWNIKLEKGNKATDWSPAPEDTQAEAEKAKKTATNYMSSDNTGIMVADLKDGEQFPANATGENVFITAGYGEGEAAVDMGVHIRNGQEDLAIFGESTRIGKENDSNVSIDNNGIIINKGSKELAKYFSKGIVFDEETPYKIGNDNSYIAFEDTDSDNKADSLNIVADSIYFRDTANTNIKDTLNSLQSDLAIAQEDIDLKNNYIKINTSEPSIVISASSNTNDTNLKLESSQLSFQIDGQTTATITNDQMNIPTASVTNLFMQSTNASTNTVYEKVWVMRTNGHLSLKTITRN